MEHTSSWVILNKDETTATGIAYHAVGCIFLMTSEHGVIASPTSSVALNTTMMLCSKNVRMSYENGLLLRYYSVYMLT